MSYYDVSLLAADGDFIARTRAAVAQEGAADPVQWAADHQWQMAGQPGFGPAYASALAAGIENPGRREEVISDAQILGAVQSLGVADPPAADEVE